MIRIYHHIWPFVEGENIAKQQKERIDTWIREEFTYHPNVVDHNQNELFTLIKLVEEIDSYDDNDFILFIHTKGASNPTLVRSEWREYMELEVIEDYKTHIEALKRGYDTSGCLMGIPYWSENIYGGNFWWATAKFIKKIPKNYQYDMKSRHQGEGNFLQLVEGWSPHTKPFFKKRELNNFSLYIVKNMLERIFEKATFLG